MKTDQLNDVGDALPVSEFDVISSIHQALIALEKHMHQYEDASSVCVCD